MANAIPEALAEMSKPPMLFASTVVGGPTVPRVPALFACVTRMFSPMPYNWSRNGALTLLVYAESMMLGSALKFGSAGPKKTLVAASWTSPVIGLRLSSD